MSHAVHTANDDEVMDAVGEAIVDTPSGLSSPTSWISTPSMAIATMSPDTPRNLERFDARLTALLPALDQSDLLVITADHGNDPTTPSTDHSREYVPLLV